MGTTGSSRAAVHHRERTVQQDRQQVRTGHVVRVFHTFSVKLPLELHTCRTECVGFVGYFMRAAAAGPERNTQ